VYNYFNGRGSTTPAVKRSIIEAELIEAYHWLPQDIKKIPYKELQNYYIIQRQKRENQHEKQNLSSQIAESKSRGTVSSSRGQAKSYKYL
jgi:hypothetical protein